MLPSLLKAQSLLVALLICCAGAVNTMECHAQSINRGELAGRRGLQLWHQSAGGEQMHCASLAFSWVLFLFFFPPPHPTGRGKWLRLRGAELLAGVKPRHHGVVILVSITSSARHLHAAFPLKAITNSCQADRQATCIFLLCLQEAQGPKTCAPQ